MLLRLLRQLRKAPKAGTPTIGDALKLYQSGSLDEADRLAREFIKAGVSVADACGVRGLVAERQARMGDAEAMFREALAERDSEPRFHLGRARALVALGRAQEAEPHLERAAALLGGEAKLAALVQLAELANQRGDLECAERHLRAAQAAAPDDPRVLDPLTLALAGASRAGEARDVARHRNAVAPTTGSRLREALIMPVIYRSRDQIAETRARVEAALAALASEKLAPLVRPEMEVGVTAFRLAYHGTNDRPLLSKLCEVVRHCYAAPGAPLEPRTSGPIRVGFVSTFFHSHSVGRTTYGLIRDLPRPDFEVHVFSIAPREDPFAEALRKAGDRATVLPADLAKVRKAIAAASLDVLVFADIGMHPLTYFLAYSRLAPVQMATWGHSETSGIDSVDWYVSGEQVEVPDADDHYSERLLRLPGYFMPRYPAVAGDATPIDRGVLGVPAEARLYACPQSAFKLHPDFDPVIRAILERDPGAAIVLLGSQPGWVKILRERFAATLAPHASRVHFTPTLAHRDFLRLLAGADVLLDPLYFGGCNSSIEALGLGAPVVTLPSQFLCGRFSLGLYRETEFEECVARDPDHFVELAVRVANDRDYRAWVRHEIATRSGRLLDRPDAGAALGAALHEIVGR